MKEIIVKKGEEEHFFSTSSSGVLLKTKNEKGKPGQGEQLEIEISFFFFRSNEKTVSSFSWNFSVYLLFFSRIPFVKCGQDGGGRGASVTQLESSVMTWSFVAVVSRSIVPLNHCLVFFCPLFSFTTLLLYFDEQKITIQRPMHRCASNESSRVSVWGTALAGSIYLFLFLVAIFHTTGQTNNLFFFFCRSFSTPIQKLTFF